MSCCVCRQRPAASGVLCEVCTETLSSSPIWPEQIEIRGVPRTPAALIDVWGQSYHLDKKMLIGRSIEEDKLIVLDPSVSRQHAELELTTGWAVRDLGSTSGTFVNDKRIEQATPIAHADRLRFGDIAMFFVDTAPPTEPRIDTPTFRLPMGGVIGLPEVTITLSAPSGGGGGVAVINGKHVQLTTPQFELLEMFVHRMRSEASTPIETRGFVPLSDLFRLSLDVSEPGEQHVRQLVFRVRRLLINAGLGDLIEVRRNVGYRLGAIPRG